MVIEATKTGLVVLDPTSAPLPVDARIAPRPDTLDGKVLGLLDNHKRNAVGLLDGVHELLSQRYELAGVVRASKPDVSRPCPQEIIDELAGSCDLVVTAIGD
ncbi:MAG: hypothetical protein V3V35_04250 [Dehalococcoidia bacterium]